MPGLAVIALCKATAVRVERLQATAAQDPDVNGIAGCAAGVLRSAGGDEVAVALEGGLRLVGFAPPGSGLRVRQRVAAAVDESSVVVALPG